MAEQATIATIIVIIIIIVESYLSAIK